jgi:hypothetical protein
MSSFKETLLNVLIPILPKVLIENIIYEYAIIFNGEKLTKEYNVNYPNCTLALDDKYAYFLAKGGLLFIHARQTPHCSLIDGQLFGPIHFLNYNIKESNWITVSNDTIYIVDNTHHKVLLFDKKSFFENLLCMKKAKMRNIGSYGTKIGKFNNPSCVIEDNGEIYVADTCNCRIQVFDKKTLDHKRIFGAKMHCFNNSHTMTIYDNELYVLTNERHGIVHVCNKITGEFIKSFENKGVGYGNLSYPRDIIVTDNEIFILNAVVNKINVYDKYTKYFLRTIELGTSIGYSFRNTNMVLDGVNLYVYDSNHYAKTHVIKEFERIIT